MGVQEGMGATRRACGNGRGKIEAGNRGALEAQSGIKADV